MSSTAYRNGRWATGASYRSVSSTTSFLDFVLSELVAFAALGTVPLRVPCHRDYTPRNRLVSTDGVHMIDFELSRADVWVNDLTRLESGPWRARPDLRAAFLSGYGREPGPADEAALRACRALTALWLIVKAREYAQPDLEAANRQALWNFMNRGR
jgi:Ser/Thr protein kinase RdoA (MazF antagonist)